MNQSNDSLVCTGFIVLLAILLIIILFTNKKAQRWARFLIKDQQIKYLLIGMVVSGIISIIPLIGGIIGNLGVIVTFIGFLIRVNQLKKDFHEFDLDDELK